MGWRDDGTEIHAVIPWHALQRVNPDSTDWRLESESPLARRPQ
jgi:hypothetical protein